MKSICGFILSTESSEYLKLCNGLHYGKVKYSHIKNKNKGRARAEELFVCLAFLNMCVSLCADNNENPCVFHTPGNLLSFVSELQRRITTRERPELVHCLLMLEISI